MPETLTAWEEQRNNFAFDKEKGEICLENFKMSRNSLYKLCQKFKSYFVKKDKTVENPYMSSISNSHFFILNKRWTALLKNT